MRRLLAIPTGVGIVFVALAVIAPQFSAYGRVSRAFHLFGWLLVVAVVITPLVFWIATIAEVLRVGTVRSASGGSPRSPLSSFSAPLGAMHTSSHHQRSQAIVVTLLAEADDETIAGSGGPFRRCRLATCGTFVSPGRPSGYVSEAVTLFG